MERFRVESLEQRRLLDGQVEVGGFVGPSGDDVPIEVYTYLDVTPAAQYVAKDGKSLSGSLGSFKGDLPADAYQATIDWGDGNSSDGTIVANADGSLSIVGAHDYADNGQYGVSVEVDGTDGSVGYSYETALMGADRLTLLGSPSLWAEPSTEATQQYLGSFFDNAADGSTSYSVTIDWGDGTSSAGNASQGYGGAWDVYGDHAYAVEGSYDVSLTVSTGSDTLQAGGTAEIATFDYIDENCLDPTYSIDIKPFFRGSVNENAIPSDAVEKGPDADQPADGSLNETPADGLEPITFDTPVDTDITLVSTTCYVTGTELTVESAPVSEASQTTSTQAQAVAPATSIFSNRLVGQQQKSLFDDSAVS